ncbi:universal stress protein [Natronococcus sp. A-GB1]|uniref:universal stress protein n=1 Tax=Natronococcus sp. A-GB1 TaxID=3037648 RepID=UPI00241DED95|nr:universal stress protein [Natronococcus sp. A-GB1]MDG5761657.1 universal stress protein [Natronococcus sp. A-GB1]
MPINTILVALKPDGDHEILVDSALDVAVPSDATIVIGVAHTETSYDAALADFDGQASPDELAERNKEVRNISKRLDEKSIDYEIRGAVGETGDPYVSLAEDVDADILFVQGQKRSPTGKALFGSTAQDLLLNAPCPVTFVRQQSK